ncbi:hypothetical protein DH2020_010474 [Rehmannia glutinosa]|uniref:Uncharacterized protein n=1 Tax=Rehmannia glutinosa TaxID=99300 RepID=A0ABR0XBG7_REHGL
MNRQPPYSDVSENPYGASQMRMQQLFEQRPQENTAINNFQGNPDSFPAVPGNIPYNSSQWNKDAPEVPVPNQKLAQLYPDARQGINSVSLHQGQVSESKTVYENQANRETGLQSHEQDMEIGYEDKPQRLTFETMEKIFQDEVLKLIEEQNHSEDEENSRHREKIMEIKNKYLEKLLALRAKQDSRRREFLKKESEERLEKYHQSEFGNPVIRTNSTSVHGYAGPVATEAHRAYPYGHTDHFDTYREQSPYLGRSQGTVGRVPYPQGRVYNNSGARF